MNTKIPHPQLVNMYGCTLENGVFIGPFVEIQKNCIVKKNTRISSHSFICEGVEIGEDCFIGHGVMFTNDIFTDSDTHLNWKFRPTKVGNRVRIGSNVTILPVTIGDDVVIGAGSVVTKDVPSGSIIKGNPAK